MPPSITEIRRIAALTNPVLRNLEITQCYCELSAAFVKRVGSGANWCTFATWASKQAGQTIRREDLQRTLEVLLKKEVGVEEVLSLMVTVAKDLGAAKDFEQLKQSALGVLLADAAGGASDAISRGNKKVFEEIAFEFARFMQTCSNDLVYTQTNIDHFCKQLQAGDPPEGQDYLCKAFTYYYISFFETDIKKKSELQLLGNIEIGFHEQTRLQPEIIEALNAGLDVKHVKERLFSILFKDTGFWGKMQLFFQRLFNRTTPLDKAIDQFILEVQMKLRTILTAHLMTLTLPPDQRLCLGQDLEKAYPDSLKELANANLLALLSKVDPTENSLDESGATDWADLAERLHFIADLFRCYHEDKELFNPAFTAEQIASLKQGSVPEGNL